MREFYGGQIKPEHRGDLAVVIREEKLRYSAFLYPIQSEEFLQLTGVQAIRNFPHRVYIGISHPSGEDILRKINGESLDGHKLENLDRIVVNAPFL